MERITAKRLKFEAKLAKKNISRANSDNNSSMGEGSGQEKEKSGSIESESSDDEYDSGSAISEIEGDIKELNKGKSFYEYNPQQT